MILMTQRVDADWVGPVHRDYPNYAVHGAVGCVTCHRGAPVMDVALNIVPVQYLDWPAKSTRQAGYRREFDVLRFKVARRELPLLPQQSADFITLQYYPTNRIAHRMWQMVDAINHKYLPPNIEAVTCYTCHHGAKWPTRTRGVGGLDQSGVQATWLRILRFTTIPELISASGSSVSGFHFWSLPRTSMAGLENDPLGESVFADAHARSGYDAGVDLSDPTDIAAPRVPGGRRHVESHEAALERARDSDHDPRAGRDLERLRACIKGYWRETFVETMSPVQTLSIDNHALRRAGLPRCPKPSTAIHEPHRRADERRAHPARGFPGPRRRDPAGLGPRSAVSSSTAWPKESSVIIDLPFTHQDLANMIGTARETVSRNMARFRAEGYVRDNGMATLEVLDLRKLEALFCLACPAGPHAGPG